MISWKKNCWIGRTKNYLEIEEFSAGRRSIQFVNWRSICRTKIYLEIQKLPADRKIISIKFSFDLQMKYFVSLLMECRTAYISLICGNLSIWRWNTSSICKWNVNRHIVFLSSLQIFFGLQMGYFFDHLQTVLWHSNGIISQWTHIYSICK